MSYPPSQKPPQWSIDSGVVAYNASRLGLPMPVGLWAMWERGGDKTFDLSGNRNHGTLTGSTTWKSDGILFDRGTGDLISLATRIQIVANHTIFFIVTNESASHNNDMIFGEDDVSQNIIYITNTPELKLNDDDNTTKIWSLPSIPVNIPTNYCIKNDGINWEAYQNGVSLGTQAYGAHLDFDDIGNAYTNDTYSHDGLILFVCVFDVFTPSQVKVLSANPYGLITDPYQIETMAYVAAAGGISIPVAMHHYTKNIRSG